jgi:small subunit ribosomal protein S17e
MGRIKQTYLKRVAEKLMKEYAEEFNADFDNNKKKVAAYTDLESIPSRNKIAGAITRMVVAKSKKVE